MTPKTFAPIALLALLTLGGCTCGGGGDSTDGGQTDVDGGTRPDAGDLTGLRSLELRPANVSLTAVNDTPGTQVYTLTGHFEGDRTRDLSEFVELYLDDPRLGTFQGPTFTSSTTVGGKTLVRAAIADLSAEAQLEVLLEKQVTDGDPTLPSTPENLFSGSADPARAPQLVYPNDDVLLPPNLGGLEFHFRKGHAANTLFELSFKNALTDVRVYLRCSVPTGLTLPPDAADGCIYAAPAQVFGYVADTNRGGPPLEVRVRATDDSGSGPVGTSAPLTLRIARSDVQGGLFYWTVSPETGVMRYDFGARTRTEPLKVLGRAQAGDTCVGCHALSRDGKKIVASAGGQNDGRVLLYDLGTNTSKVPFGSTPKSQFSTWSPDGERYAGVYADSGADDFQVMLFDGSSGAKLGSVPGTGTAANPATHPDWSPDGKTLVYVRQGVAGTNQRFHRGSILAVEQRTDGTWSAPHTVVPEASGRNRYYPAIAPDSTFLAFNESTCPSTDPHPSCNSDTDPDAALFAARLVANAPRIALTRANAPGIMDGATTALSNSYPKWNPFEVRGNDGPDSRLQWVTFSSTRRYGLRRPPAGGLENPKGTLLWMAAVDPDRIAADLDGSHPAFALPMQDPRTTNHIAQWAKYAVVDGCATGGESCQEGGGGPSCCGGLSCESVSSSPTLPCDVAGNCVCRQEVTCALTGESCSASSPCCGTLSCQNAAGGACTGEGCLCQPSCNSLGQACGGGSGACCSGLLCLGSNGGACTGADCACRLGID